MKVIAIDNKTNEHLFFERISKVELKMTGSMFIGKDGIQAMFMYRNGKVVQRLAIEDYTIEIKN